MWAILAAAGTTAFAAESIAKSNSIGTAAAEKRRCWTQALAVRTRISDTRILILKKGSFVYEVEFTANGIEVEDVIKASAWHGALLRRAKVQRRPIPPKRARLYRRYPYRASPRPHTPAAPWHAARAPCRPKP